MLKHGHRVRTIKYVYKRNGPRDIGLQSQENEKEGNEGKEWVGITERTAGSRGLEKKNVTIIAVVDELGGIMRV